MLNITLLGTGSPIPDPQRAGPATLISGGGEHYLVDAGRGVLMRMAAAMVGAGNLTAVLLTHLHSDHIVASLGPDIGYRIAHHEDLQGYGFPPVAVIEVTDGEVDLGGTVKITCAPTDHRPVHPTVGFRFDHEGASVVTAGDTVPCDGLDRLCEGAQALVHTVIRKDVIENVPLQRMKDTLDYHSSPEEAAQTAARASMEVLVMTHYVPAFASGGGDDWEALAAAHFDGAIELGDDLHRVEVRAHSQEVEFHR